MRRHIDYKIPLEVHKPIRGIITPVGCPMGQPTGRPMGCLMGTNMSGIWGVLRDVTQESQKCTSIRGLVVPTTIYCASEAETIKITVTQVIH